MGFGFGVCCGFLFFCSALQAKNLKNPRVTIRTFWLKTKPTRQLPISKTRIYQAERPPKREPNDAKKRRKDEGNLQNSWEKHVLDREKEAGLAGQGTGVWGEAKIENIERVEWTLEEDGRD